MNIDNLVDRLELKELVDRFSILADKKEISEQVKLFCNDASVKSYSGENLISELNSHEEILDAFTSFLSLFKVVYHINGQQVVDIDGTRATGTSYCQVVLIKDENFKEVVTTQGVRYEDEYEKVDGKWLIKNRVSHFDWTLVN